MPPRRRGGHDTETVVAAAAASYPPSSSTPCSSTITMSSRKISSESFSSSVGSDCGLESPGRDGSLEATEENRGCPFSSFTSSHRSVIWNGRSSNDKPAFPAVEEQGPVGSQKRITRRRRVNLDSLGESLRRLTSPMVGLSSSMIKYHTKNINKPSLLVVEAVLLLRELYKPVMFVVHQSLDMTRMSQSN